MWLKANEKKLPEKTFNILNLVHHGAVRVHTHTHTIYHAQGKTAAENVLAVDGKAYFFACQSHVSPCTYHIYISLSLFFLYVNPHSTCYLLRLRPLH